MKAYIVDSGVSVLNTSISSTALRSVFLNNRNELFDNDTKSIRKHEIFKAVATCLIDSGCKGISAKEIALRCDISIYTARYYLLKLQDLDVARSETLNKSHQWYLSNISAC